MSIPYRYAIIGTGRPWKSEGATGFGMAHSHYPSFKSTERIQLVAISDIDADTARYFLEKQEAEAKVYADYHQMLAEEKPDILSICVWPHLHAEMTVAACEAGVPAVHCEKPMATTWGDAKRMQAAAHANGTILTFNHQRRFLEPFQRAKTLLREGEIGDLQRIEAECGDLYDWGTHWLDMLQFFNDETPGEWVMAQVDSRNEKRIFGAYAEEQGLCQIKYANGVRGLMVTGHQAKLDAAIRLIGTKGTIEILWEKPCLRIRATGDADWRVIETQEGLHDGVAIHRAAADLVRALDEPGYKPLLSVDNAINTAEIIFAAYRSSQWRGRTDLPLTHEGNALVEMVDAGEIGPSRSG